MKPHISLKLLGVGAIALTTLIAFSQPASAKPKVTVTTTDGNTGQPVPAHNRRVVPVVVQPANCGSAAAPCAPAPVAPAPRVQAPCQPTGVTPCAAPVAAPPRPACQPGVTPCNQPVLEPALSSQDYFFCGAGRNRMPTTFVNTPTGNVPLIRWVSEQFAGGLCCQPDWRSLHGGAVYPQTGSGCHPDDPTIV